MAAMDRLWPDPQPNLPLDSLAAGLDLDAPADRPMVALNMVTSVDGRAQRDGRADEIGSRDDRRLMQLLRAEFGAVATGAGTLVADDFYARLAPDLAAARAERGLAAQPLAVLVAGAGKLPLDRRYFGEPRDQRRVVVVGANSPHAVEQPLPNVETWVAPTRRPDPAWIAGRLHDEGVGSLMLEGGPSVNAAFLAAGLVDEIFWTIGPRVIGAAALPMIAALPDAAAAGLPRDARLASVHRVGDELFLRYRLASDSIGP